MIENLLMYTCAKHCHKRWSSDKAIAKIKRCSFFCLTVYIWTPCTPEAGGAGVQLHQAAPYFDQCLCCSVQHALQWLYEANSAFHPAGVGKWVPASAGKAKAGMVHSISGWIWGVQVKLWDPLRKRAIPERLRDVIMTRRYINPRLPLPFTIIDVNTSISAHQVYFQSQVKLKVNMDLYSALSWTHL